MWPRKSGNRRKRQSLTGSNPESESGLLPESVRRAFDGRRRLQVEADRQRRDQAVEERKRSEEEARQRQEYEKFKKYSERNDLVVGMFTGLHVAVMNEHMESSNLDRNRRDYFSSQPIVVSEASDPMYGKGFVMAYIHPLKEGSRTNDMSMEADGYLISYTFSRKKHDAEYKDDVKFEEARVRIRYDDVLADQPGYWTEASKGVLNVVDDYSYVGGSPSSWVDPRKFDIVKFNNFLRQSGEVYKYLSTAALDPSLNPTLVPHAQANLLNLKDSGIDPWQPMR